MFINFTNPVGLVTEAVRRILGDRVIGICDAPLALCRRVAAALDRDPGDLWFDYFGINHLGWLRAVLDHGRDLLPDLLADERRLLAFEEGRLFGADWLRSVGMIPNEYLYYYDFANEALAGMQAGRVRAEFLSRQQDAFYRGSGSRRRRAPTVGGTSGGARGKLHGGGLVGVVTRRCGVSPPRGRPAATGGCRPRSRRRAERRRPRGDDPERRQPIEPAVPRRPRSSRSPASSGGAASCRSRSEPCRWRPRA